MQLKKQTIGLSILAVALLLLMMPAASAQTEQQPAEEESATAPLATSSAAAATADADTTASTEAGVFDSAAEDALGGEIIAPENSAELAKPKDSGSSEVEYNEQNYRRFMELRDQDPRTSTLPTNAFQSGTQKLDELPESSQKHLRNELRGVIVEEGEWEEGDENNRYAYVPSEAAKSDRELELKEAEAWDELVDKYQEREAQIHANATRSEAARKAGDAAGSSENRQASQQDGSQQGSDGQGTESQGQSGQGQGQDGQSGQAGQESQQSTSASSKDQAQARAASEAMQEEARNAGVSENALQFLTQGQGSNSSGNKDGGAKNGTGQNDGQPGNQPQQGEQAQAGQQAQQGSQQSEQAQAGQQAQQGPQQGEQAQTGQQAQQEPARQESAQNALQFLTQNQADESQASQQADQQDAQPATEQDSQQTADAEQSAQNTTESDAENEVAEVSEEQPDEPTAEPMPTFDSTLVTDVEEVSEAGTTQNAFETLSRGSRASPPADTLSIEELLNAQGVTIEVSPGESNDNDGKETSEPDNG